jgi:hypothetical protein
MSAAAYFTRFVEPFLVEWFCKRKVNTTLRANMPRVGEMPIARRAPWHCTSFEFLPHAAIIQSMPSQLQNKVFHGTLWHCLARILTTGELHASDGSLGLGMETHVEEPAIYTAETLKHALKYAIPCGVLGDNTYCSVLLEMVVNTHAILKRCNRGEVLVKPSAAGRDLLIKNVVVFFNIDVGGGYPKCPEFHPHEYVGNDWVRTGENFELLPAELGTPESSAVPLRPECWNISSKNISRHVHLNPPLGTHPVVRDTAEGAAWETIGSNDAWLLDQAPLA